MEQKSTADIAKEIAQNKQKFIEYNNVKIQNFHRSLSNKEIINLIDAIPLLITCNYPGLPGYVEEFTPIGIYGFTPTNNAFKLLKTKFPTINFSGYKNSNPIIELFAIMGSVGSIAYNEESDIDFWICIDEKKISPEDIDRLKLKLREIEMWITDKFNIETHFFLNDITKIYNDTFDTDEHDISGKAMGKLLKEEFYRSSILLKGKIPFWWVVPGGVDDTDYNKYLNTVNPGEFQKEYVDLGNLYTIDEGDFIGGGLFQILKSLGNPFKSIIKLGIVERYLLDGSSNKPLLCNIIKTNVQTNNLTTDFIDPYLLMFKQVLEYYLKNRNDVSPTAIEILKICFYIKLDAKLSKYVSLHDGSFVKAGENLLSYKDVEMPEKVLKMLELVKKWNWTESKLRQIDNFHNWDITTVNKFWNNITKEILKSYKRLISNFAKHRIKESFSDDKLKYITRKISSSFSFSENKIRHAVSFKDNPIEKYLSVESVSEKSGKISWLVIKGFATDYKRIIIHKGTSLIAVLTWISINRLYKNDFTRVEIKSRYHLLNPNFVRELLNELTLHFSIKKLDIKNWYFFRDPFPLLNFIIVNLHSKYPKGIEDIYYLYHNSWGETVYEKFESELDFVSIMVKMLNGALRHKKNLDDCIWLTSPYPFKASKEFKNIQTLILEMYIFFVRQKDDETEEDIEGKYITIIGNNFILFTKSRSKGEYSITGRIFESELKLLYSLSNVSGIKTLMKFDPNRPELNYLRTINQNNDSSTVQIYFQSARKYSYFFVSDERGSITFYRKNSDYFGDYLAKLNVFSKNVIKQIALNNPESTLNVSEKKVRVYKLERDASYNCSIKEIQESSFKNERDIDPFIVSVSQLANGEIGYSFVLPEGRTTEVIKKSDILKTAQQLRALLKNINGSSYFVTNLDLTKLTAKTYKNNTSFSFTEKNMLELLLERAFNR